MDDQISVFLEPAVQVHPTAEGVKPVIRQHHEQRGVVFAPGHGPANQLIHADIQIFNGGLKSDGNLGGARRMGLVKISPEHVLDAVGSIEDTDAKTFRNFIKSVKKHRFPFPVDVGALLQKMFVFENLLAESPSILGQPECRIGALLLGEIDRIDSRITNRHSGMFGVKMDGGHVEIKLGVGFQEQPTTESLNGNAPASAKPHGDPISVLPLLQGILGPPNR